MFDTWINQFSLMGFDMFKMCWKKIKEGDATFLWSLKLNRVEWNEIDFSINISFEQYLLVVWSWTEAYYFCSMNKKASNSYYCYYLVPLHGAHSLFAKYRIFSSRYSYNFHPNEDEHHQNTQRWTLNVQPNAKSNVRSLHTNCK